MGRECARCGGQGEVPTPETAHLAGQTVGGFEHPNLCFQLCHECGGTGLVEVPAVSA